MMKGGLSTLFGMLFHMELLTTSQRSKLHHLPNKPSIQNAIFNPFIRQKLTSSLVIIIIVISTPSSLKWRISLAAYRTPHWQLWPWQLALAPQIAAEHCHTLHSAVALAHRLRVSEIHSQSRLYCRRRGRACRRLHRTRQPSIPNPTPASTPHPRTSNYATTFHPANRTLRLKRISIFHGFVQFPTIPPSYLRE